SAHSPTTSASVLADPIPTIPLASWICKKTISTVEMVVRAMVYGRTNGNCRFSKLTALIFMRWSTDKRFQNRDKLGTSFFQRKQDRYTQFSVQLRFERVGLGGRAIFGIQRHGNHPRAILCNQINL